MYQAVIIEDDPVITSINSSYLKEFKQFTKITSFRRADEGLKYVLNNDIDLILLDYHLPGLNGGEFLKELRDQGDTAEVIVITMDNEIDSATTAFSFGAMDYLIKPFAKSRFMEAIDTFLNIAETKKSKMYLSQSELDMYIKKSKEVISETKLKKGLQEETYNKLLAYLKNNKNKSLKLDLMESEIGLSKVTIRRYMDYLLERGTVRVEIDYTTGGRPSMLYIYEE